ncbi:MAG: YceI family protein, partial [Thermoanaerobaculia bacterium]|nr:YceI family protein [Thermoanaerobaculia bacterium]
MKSIIVYILCATVWPVAAVWRDGGVPPEKNVYQCVKGRIHFRSDAPLEIIEARSNRLRGVIDPANQQFAWTVEINTFEGFNSPLQREHFNENYMETSKYPGSTFTGKIIEKINFEQDGSYPVRAKGKLLIHGVEQERIIKGTLEVKGQKLRIQATFTVPLTDHNITIPKIVHQKIAEEITV